MNGCIVDEEPVKELIEVDKPNVVRLTGPKDSLQDWFSKHPAAGFRVDIVGGSWPELLVRGRSSKKAAEPSGAANRGQPIRSDTNSAPPAAGSGR